MEQAAENKALEAKLWAKKETSKAEEKADDSESGGSDDLESKRDEAESDPGKLEPPGAGLYQHDPEPLEPDRRVDCGQHVRAHGF